MGQADHSSACNSGDSDPGMQGAPCPGTARDPGWALAGPWSLLQSRCPDWASRHRAPIGPTRCSPFGVCQSRDCTPRGTGWVGRACPPHLGVARRSTPVCAAGRAARCRRRPGGGAGPTAAATRPRPATPSGWRQMAAGSAGGDPARPAPNPEPAAPLSPSPDIAEVPDQLIPRGGANERPRLLIGRLGRPPRVAARAESSAANESGTVGPDGACADGRTGGRTAPFGCHV